MQQLHKQVHEVNPLPASAVVPNTQATNQMVLGHEFTNCILVVIPLAFWAVEK